MSAIRSSRADRYLLTGWVAFVTANVGAMFLLPGLETIPFHFVWISTTIVYGLRPWSLPRTYAVLVIVCLVTGTALLRHVDSGVIGWEEATEVPLMALVFLAMVWHVRRRVAAVEEAQRLARSERATRDEQKRFARFASHELRTPLTVAHGYTELIRSECLDPDVAQDSGIVLDELAKIERIAAQLLTLGEVDSRARMQLAPVDVDELLRRDVTRWRAAAERDWALTTSAGSICADAWRLETAIDALVENAVRHTEAGGRIRLVGQRLGSTVEIGVHDDGIGIEPEDMTFIFEGFRSGGPRAGTGMGLAIARAAVEAHEGAISAQSRPGRGAMFTMRLPVGGPGMSEARQAEILQSV